MCRSGLFRACEHHHHFHCRGARTRSPTISPTRVAHRSRFGPLPFAVPAVRGAGRAVPDDRRQRCGRGHRAGGALPGPGRLVSMLLLRSGRLQAIPTPERTTRRWRSSTVVPASFTLAVTPVPCLSSGWPRGDEYRREHTPGRKRSRSSVSRSSLRTIRAISTTTSPLLRDEPTARIQTATCRCARIVGAATQIRSRAER
jgi:hypothetical protein